MASFGEDVLTISITISYVSILAAFILSFVRLVIGPTLADRVVALDLIAFLTIAVIAVYTLDTQQKAFLDIAITLGLVSFLGTVAFARFIIKRDDEIKEE